MLSIVGPASFRSSSVQGRRRIASISSLGSRRPTTQTITGADALQRSLRDRASRLAALQGLSVSLRSGDAGGDLARQGDRCAFRGRPAHGSSAAGWRFSVSHWRSLVQNVLEPMMISPYCPGETDEFVHRAAPET